MTLSLEFEALTIEGGIDALALGTQSLLRINMVAPAGTGLNAPLP